MGFYRLSMPIECAAVLTSPVGGVLPVASNTLSPGSGDVASNHIQFVQVSHRKLEMTSQRATVGT